MCLILDFLTFLDYMLMMKFDLTYVQNHRNYDCLIETHSSLILYTNYVFFLLIILNLFFVFLI